MNHTTSYFPMMMNLTDKPCLVVGAGKIAADKIASLLAYDAKVTVVSPRSLASIRSDARSGQLVLLKRAFRPDDVIGAALVVAATNVPRTNAAVYRACAVRCILCNSVDDPEHCDFIYPAVVRRGALQIAVSTGGASPALAARLRRELERQFGTEWEAWVRHLSEQRRCILEQPLSAGEKKKRLLRIASASAFRHFTGRNRKSSRGRRSRTG